MTEKQKGPAAGNGGRRDAGRKPAPETPEQARRRRFAEALARQAFGRHYWTDDQGEEVRRSLDAKGKPRKRT